MIEKKIKSVWPEWEIVGELGSGTHGRSFLAKKTMANGGTLYRTIKEVQIAPQKGAIQTALDLGISVEALEDYFDVFKGDMDWELNIYRLADSDKLSKNEEFTLVDSDKEPGWTGYVRRDLYTPINEFYGDKPTGENEAVEIGKDICEALVACEDMYMVHGGVSYNNVLVDDRGKAVLVDYGVNRCTSKAGVKLFKPTHEYDAPEVIADGDYTKYSDIYSLGMTLISIANGGVLTSSKNLKNVFSPKFADIIEKAVAKNSWERYRSADEMLSDLNRISSHQSVEGGQSAVQRAILSAHEPTVVQEPTIQPASRIMPKSADPAPKARKIVVAKPRIDKLNGETIRLEPINKTAEAARVMVKEKAAEPEIILPASVKPVKTVKVEAQPVRKGESKAEKPAKAEVKKTSKEPEVKKPAQPKTSRSYIEELERQHKQEREAQPIIDREPAETLTAVQTQPEDDTQKLDMFFGENADPLADGGAQAEAAEAQELVKTELKKKKADVIDIVGGGINSAVMAVGGLFKKKSENNADEPETEEKGFAQTEEQKENSEEAEEKPAKKERKLFRRREKKAREIELMPEEDEFEEEEEYVERRGFRVDWRILAAAGVILAAALLIIFKPWNRSVPKPADEAANAADSQVVEEVVENNEPETVETQPEAVTEPNVTEDELVVVDEPTVQQEETVPEVTQEETTQPETQPEDQPEPQETPPTETAEPETTEPAETAQPEVPDDPVAQFLATYETPEYIFDQRVISESELEGKSQIELSVLLNSIYAHHGRTFKNEYLQAYFESQPWYTANPTDKDLTEEFTRTEISNMNIITKYQKKMGYR